MMGPGCDICGYDESLCVCNKNPDPDIAKLRELSPELYDLISDLQQFEHTEMVLLYVLPESGEFRFHAVKESFKAIARQFLALATENERLETELGFKYGKQCQCGYTVWIIPNDCKDGSS
jgi:hypothetical protein